MQDIKIEEILKVNLKDFLSKEIDKEIIEALADFERILKQNKDNYIEHIMKNIRILHEYNNADNKINYQITFVNEYKIKESEEDVK